MSERILFDRPYVIFQGEKYVAVEGNRIISITDERPVGAFDRVISGAGRLLLPGLYNCHTHVPMTLFRGYGEELPLDRWLHERIFPAEDRLTSRSVRAASLLAEAEMIKNGVVSFTDMYNFCDDIVSATLESGMKANISRPVLSFDPAAVPSEDIRVREGEELFETCNNIGDGRIKIDMALHAEYTNQAHFCRHVADYAASHGAGIHVHLSETKAEHEECVARHGRTPAEFFLDNGVLDVPVTAAHCVWATDGDIEIFREKKVNVAHNPASNLKLGSGVMPLCRMLDKGVNVTLGTDGAASNNTLDIMKEMYLAAILHKGVELRAEAVGAETIIKMATENGAAAQGRPDCGRIAEGFKADLILLDLDTVNNIPMYDAAYTAVYSASSADVRLTMCDGRVLYENGEYKTLDIERVKHDMRDVCAGYFD